MIDRKALLGDLTKLVGVLESDLRTRATKDVETDRRLRAEWVAAKDRARTGEAYEVWVEDRVTQAAVAWVLACVFVRFLEDNELLDRPYLSGPGSGPGSRRQLAMDHETAYFRAHPAHSNRDALLATFRTVGALPAMGPLLGEAHNPLWQLQLSADGAEALVKFWRSEVPETGALVHDFTDPAWDTRHLGDLYQDLSEAAKKRYALLQTPDFILTFILDRTLEPAIQEFGYREIRLIDPACGSGHFLLEAFRRLVQRRLRDQPAINSRELAQRALDQVYGVDLNPYAVAIARFRLLIEALRVAGVRRLSQAPDFKTNLAVGDSLLHGSRPGRESPRQRIAFPEEDRLAHVYDTEDAAALGRLLGQRYHVVVGNPPYPTPKDPALNAAYRGRFDSCHRQYSLAVPFTERLFDLALAPADGMPSRAGYVGMITANSFMKREFGRKLIEEFVPSIDLTHVIDTSLAFVPGHGTPTVLMFGRSRAPVNKSVRVVGAIRREDGEPDPPESGKVWMAILNQVDAPGSMSEFVSVSDTDRETLHVHPWSIGGGGAAELKQVLDEGGAQVLDDFVEEIGFLVITGEDNCLLLEPGVARRLGLRHVVPLCDGEQIRDWDAPPRLECLWPNTPGGTRLPTADIPEHLKYCWRYRTNLRSRRAFGVPVEQRGIPWWALRELYFQRLRAPLSIAFAFVATHNHFVLDRGGMVFKQSAPIMKLAATATEDDHLDLLGLLNSSTACFWMKQVFHDKGGGGVSEGVRAEQWERFFEYDSTKIRRFPVPWAGHAGERSSGLARAVLGVARDLDTLVQARARLLPAALLAAAADAQAATLELGRTLIDAAGAATHTEAADGQLDGFEGRVLRQLVRVAQAVTHANPPCVHADRAAPATPPSRPDLDIARAAADLLMAEMITLQEEIDWLAYRAFGLLEGADSGHDSPPPGQLGERAFEIVMARRGAAGAFQTEWFRRHGSERMTDVPARWPADYRRVVEHRITLIKTNPDIALIEQPEYKRRWNTEPWEQQEERAIRGWLLDRLEDPRYWPEPPALTTCARLADRLRHDPEFLQVAELYRGRADFDLTELVVELVEDEAVPFLPALRYSESGRRTRAAWERTWELQRREDAGEKVEIDVPPRYASGDFAKPIYWRLRGKLDVPKERFILYPLAGSDADPTPVIGWAGWNHLQQARALAGWFVERQNKDGWEGSRLRPLLAGVLELVPWLRQWHNEVDSESGQRLGDYFAAWVEAEARKIQATLDDLRAWLPPAGAGRKRRARKGTSEA